MSKDDLVSHPFPKKGTPAMVKRSYREFLIAQAKKAGKKDKPAPLSNTVKAKSKPADKKKPAVKKPTSAKSKSKPPVSPKKAAPIPAPVQEEETGPIRYNTNNKLIKPPVGKVELWIPCTKEGFEQKRKLSAIKERNSADVEWRYYSMEHHVFWVTKKYSII